MYLLFIKKNLMRACHKTLEYNWQFLILLGPPITETTERNASALASKRPDLNVSFKSVINKDP